MSDETYLPLGQIIRRARGSLKQAAVEAQLGLAAGMVSRWEHGQRIKHVATMHRACDTLNINFRVFLTVWVACETDSVRKAELASLLGEFQHAYKTDLHGLQVQTLIMGDRRNEPASHVSDFALQVSISDLFFLAHLRCPMQIWFDKLVVVNNTSLVPRAFTDHDVLMVGSPAVNLASRLVNRHAAFRFYINRNIDRLESALAKHGPNLARSLHRDKKTRAAIAKVIDGNRGQGFIDPLQPGVSHRTRVASEKGILTFAPNPWNSDKLVILAAGQGGAATAASLQLLARDTCFHDRPLGGVFEVNDLRELDRSVQFEHLDPQWVTRGYDFDKYLDAASKHSHCDVDRLRPLVAAVRERVVPSLAVATPTANDKGMASGRR